MLGVVYSARFRRDLKASVKKGYDLSKLYSVIETLRIPEELPDKNRDHSLTGNYAGYRECHIAPDWLLIYRFRDNELYLYRCGTHSDLF